MVKNVSTETNKNSDEVSTIADDLELINQRILALKEYTEKIDSQLGRYAGMGDLVKRRIKQETQVLVESYGAEDPNTLVKNISTGAFPIEEAEYVPNLIGDLVTLEHAEACVDDILGYYYPRLSTPIRPIHFEKPTGEPICLTMFTTDCIFSVQETPDGNIFTRDSSGSISYFIRSRSADGVDAYTVTHPITATADDIQVVANACLYTLRPLVGTISRWTIDSVTNQSHQNNIDIVQETDTEAGKVLVEFSDKWTDMKVHPSGDIYGSTNHGLYRLTRNESGQYVANLLREYPNSKIFQILPDGSLYVRYYKGGDYYLATYNSKTGEWKDYRKYSSELYYDNAGYPVFHSYGEEGRNARFRVDDDSEWREMAMVYASKFSPIQITSDKSVYRINKAGALVRHKSVKNGRYAESEIIFSPKSESKSTNKVIDFQVCDGHIVCGTSGGEVYIIR